MREKDVLFFITEKIDLDLTSGWFNCFFIRHNDILQKGYSTPQEDKRISIRRDFLRLHLINVHENVEGWCVEVDLGQLEDCKVFKVVIDRGYQGDSIEHSDSRKFLHTTMLACIAAPLITKKSNFYKILGFRS